MKDIRSLSDLADSIFNEALRLDRLGLGDEMVTAHLEVGWNVLVRVQREKDAQTRARSVGGHIH